MQRSYGSKQEKLEEIKEHDEEDYYFINQTPQSQLKQKPVGGTSKGRPSGSPKRTLQFSGDSRFSHSGNRQMQEQ